MSPDMLSDLAGLSYTERGMLAHCLGRWLHRRQAAARLTECCGAPRARYIDCGGAFEAQCRDCGNDVCSHCAGSWTEDGGFGEGGNESRVRARCVGCEDARHAVALEAR